MKTVNVLSEVKREVLFRLNQDVGNVSWNIVLKGVLWPLRKQVWGDVLGHHREDSLLSDLAEVRRRVVRRLLGLDV